MTASANQATMMNAATAAKWCEEQNGRLEYCVVMSLAGAAWTEEQIHKAVVALVPGQRMSVVDMKTDQGDSQTLVLLEWRRGIPICFQGPSLKLTNDVEAQLIQPSMLEARPGGSDQESTAGGAMSQMPATVIGPEILNALGGLVEKCLKSTVPYTGFGYRKLRPFSGKPPVAAGEDSFEEWLDQAMQALDEWDIPESQRKQRITESLSGPALEAIRNLKLSQPNCRAYDYLSILQDVFGSTEKASDLMYRFEHTYQSTDEKLSDYMRRLDKIMHQVLLKKGIDPKEVDEVRSQQVLRGAQPLDPVMLQLKTRKDGGILKYPELIKIIREEEALLESKQDTVRSKSTAEVNVVGPVTGDSEVESLKSQISQMMEMMNMLATKISTLPGEKLSEHNQHFATRTPFENPARQMVCFNCGREGHTQRACTYPSMSRNQRQKPQGNSRGPW